MDRRTLLKGTLTVGAFAAASGLGYRNALAATPAKIGVIIPMSGPGGMFGPPCKDCAELAAAEIDRRGGLAGHPIELTFIDAGNVPPAEAAQAVLKAWKTQHVEAFVGFNDSADRLAINGVLRGQVPYIYTSLYEGGECSPGVYVVGETPAQQLAPVIPWIGKQRGLRKWYLIGNDYNWPRETNVLAKQYIASSGAEVVGEEYVPFTVDNFDASVAKIKSSGADAVLITLVGGSNIGFNRAFASFGLPDKVTRLSPAVEELTLAGIGAQNSRNLFASAGYFTVGDTPAARKFNKDYTDKFGAKAFGSLSFLSESVYEGMLLLEAMVKKAGSLDPAKMEAAAEGARFSSPRGMTTMHERHGTKDIYLAEAEGADFKIVHVFDQVGAGKNCKA